MNETFVRTVEITPFRDGIARNSWFVNLGGTNGGEGARPGKQSGQDSINAIYAETSKLRLGDSFNLRCINAAPSFAVYRYLVIDSQFITIEINITIVALY